ncbi:hypothetical protein [Micromonospora sp. NPDC049301]|uniref:hypothetical protein n=1 Tax=Micromonospora sp. NPDC049301 TaxID=3155723 RepID=UPI0034406C56
MHNIRHPRPTTNDPPRTASPSAAFLIMAGWYAALIALFGIYISMQSTAVPQGCREGCDSERSRLVLFAIYSAMPGVFVAFLVSLLVLWLTTTRTRMRSTILAGSAAGAPAVVLAAILAKIAPTASGFLP